MSYTETWKCPECGQIEKFTRPKQRVWHDCRGKNFSMPEHSVDLVKIEEEIVNE